MKIRKAVQWMVLGVIWNLNAQSNYSADFSVNTKPAENVTINEMGFGIGYSKNFRSKYKIANELEYNSKNINYFNINFSNSLTAYNDLRNRFSFSYLMNKKMNFTVRAEPYIASENNLKATDMDWLGELNVSIILSSNKTLTIGAAGILFLEKRCCCLCSIIIINTAKHLI